MHYDKIKEMHGLFLSYFDIILSIKNSPELDTFSLLMAIAYSYIYAYRQQIYPRVILLRPPCKFAVTNCSLVTASTFGFVAGTIMVDVVVSFLMG